MLIEPTLGSTTSLIEALFALNLAFGIWDGVVTSGVRNLRERIDRIRNHELYESSYSSAIEARDTIAKNQENYQNKIKRALSYGQLFAWLIAASLLLLLLLSAIYPNFELHGSWLSCLLFIFIPTVGISPSLITYICYRWFLSSWDKTITESERLIATAKQIDEIVQSYISAPTPQEDAQQGKS